MFRTATQSQFGKTTPLPLLGPAAVIVSPSLALGRGSLRVAGLPQSSNIHRTHLPTRGGGRRASRRVGGVFLSFHGPLLLFAFSTFIFDAPAAELTPQQQAIRSVVQGIVKRADSNAQLPARDPGKLSQDALTGEYIRTAAAIAAELPKDQRSVAFLVGVGIALDDSPLLRTNLLTRGVCAGVESAEETKARVAVLGSPTIRNRRDLCQHFAVSMALTALLGTEGAEAAGIAKELLDMRGTSGFSFIDLAADFAGVELAKRVLKDPERVKALAKGFQIEHCVPELKGLREGFNSEQFKKEFGSTSDDRYKNVVADIRTRISKLDAYKE